MRNRMVCGFETAESELEQVRWMIRVREPCFGIVSDLDADSGPNADPNDGEGPRGFSLLLASAFCEMSWPFHVV